MKCGGGARVQNTTLKNVPNPYRMPCIFEHVIRKHVVVTDFSKEQSSTKGC